MTIRLDLHKSFAGSPNFDRKFRVVGFQYVGPRITSSALSVCKHVQEAYGEKRDGKQSVILVMNNSNGIRPQRLWVVLYRLELIPCYASLINMSLYKIGLANCGNHDVSLSMKTASST
jgi:hypothetical protein